jgi:hypothetical protein
VADGREWRKMATPGNFELTAKQEKVIGLLISEPSIHEAAKVAGIGDRTIFRWLKEGAFNRAYREARSAAVRQAVGQIQAAMGRAVQTLVSIMEDVEAPASSRVAAARTMIETGIKAVELEDLESRVTALETQLKEGKK